MGLGLKYFLLILYLVFLNSSSSYLYMFGDDHVTCYMGADVDVGEHVDA